MGIKASIRIKKVNALVGISRSNTVHSGLNFISAERELMLNYFRVVHVHTFCLGYSFVTGEKNKMQGARKLNEWTTFRPNHLFWLNAWFI